MPVAQGTVLSTFQLPVEFSKAREMALALGAAEWGGLTPPPAAGHPVVPTFTASSGHVQDRRALMTGPLDLELSRVLHGEQRWRFHRPLRIGDVLAGTTTLHHAEVKQGRRGGQMRLVTLRTSYVAADELVLQEDMVLVETAPPSPEPTPASNGSSRSATTGAAPVTGLLGEPWTTEPITRTDIVRYAGASGDFTRIHHDEPYAVGLGLPGVFAMGMLQGGMLGVHLVRQIDQDRLRTLAIRFKDRVWPGDALVLRACAPGSPDQIELDVRTTDGRTVVTGSAELS